MFNKILLLIFLISTSLLPMESSDPEAPDDDLKINDYYHQETKTLDMSNLPLTDTQLNQLIKEIKSIVELTEAESLILENNKLESIPYELITFALMNKTLRYVSFKNNKFKIQNGAPQPEEISKLLAKYKTKDLSSSTTRKRAGTISDIVSTIWAGISPGIEKAISESNKSQDKTKFFKKIIIIDKRIPPITIINQDEIPKDTKTTCKEVFYKILYVGAGIVITLVPTISTYLSTGSTCDLDQLNAMMGNCNLTSYNITN